MRIILNLATRPYANIGPALKRLRIAMAVLVVMGLGLGLGLRAVHQKAEEARATVERVQHQIDAVNKERQSYQRLMQQPENAQLLTQAATLNNIFDLKTFSWTLAMEDLETVLPGGVQVTSLDPVRDEKTGSITLRLRVVGPRNKAVDLVENLEHSRYFLQPRIVGESSESGGGPNERLEPVSASNRVNFELLAEYNTTAPVERRTQHKDEKPQAGVERARQGVPLPRTMPLPQMARPLPVPAARGQMPGRLPNLGAQRLRPTGNRNPNPGGPR